MTDTPANPNAEPKGQTAAEAAGQGARLLVDVGPVAIFVVAYNVAKRLAPDDAIFIGTGVFIVASIVALVIARVHQKRFPPLLVVSAVLITVFGGTAILFKSALLIYIKPTIINLLYAGAIFGSLLVGQNVWKLLFSSVFTLPDRIWRVLAIRWGLWFVALAILNEVLWRTTSEEFWANAKLFLVLPLTFVFTLANMPLIMKHSIQTDDDEGEKADPSA